MSVGDVQITRCQGGGDGVDLRGRVTLAFPRKVDAGPNFVFGDHRLVRMLTRLGEVGAVEAERKESFARVDRLDGVGDVEIAVWGRRTKGRGGRGRRAAVS